MLPTVRGKCESSYFFCHTRQSKTTWWRHQTETFSALLALLCGNSPVTGEFPSQWPVTWSFDVFFDLQLYKQLSKQSWGWWFETPSHSLWRHCNEEEPSRYISQTGSDGYPLVFGKNPVVYRNHWYLQKLLGQMQYLVFGFIPIHTLRSYHRITIFKVRDKIPGDASPVLVQSNNHFEVVSSGVNSMPFLKIIVA